jgi:hypothetical protein
LKIDDPRASEKIIRILRVGSCDYQLQAVSFYNFMGEYMPCFQCCYGKSQSLALRTMDYMQDVGVSAKDLEDVLDNYDARWKAYIKEFIPRSIVENELDVFRMSNGEKCDKTIFETLEKLQNVTGIHTVKVGDIEMTVTEAAEATELLSSEK